MMLAVSLGNAIVYAGRFYLQHVASRISDIETKSCRLERTLPR